MPIYTPVSTRAMFDHFATVGNTTIGGADDTLYTDTLSAGVLNKDGIKLITEYGGRFISSGTASRQVKVKFGPSGSEATIFDTGALTLSLSSAWTISATLTRASSTSVRYQVMLTTQGAALAAYTSVGEVTGLVLTNAQVLKITGASAGVGAATSDVTVLLGNSSLYSAA